MIRVRLRQDLDLNEVLVSLKKWELLEKSLPGNGILLLLTHELLSDLRSLFHLSQDDISRGERHVVSRVHSRKGWCNDREAVTF